MDSLLICSRAELVGDYAPRARCVCICRIIFAQLLPPSQPYLHIHSVFVLLIPLPRVFCRRSFSASRDVTKPLGASKYSAIETSIDIKQSENNRHTVLRVITRDRPGLLVDMVHILKDVSVNVLSAEIDTIGEEADDTLLITYHGEPLSSSMEMLVKNALQYYLSLADVAKVESY